MPPEHPFHPDGRPEELIVAIDAEGVVRHTSRPDWAEPGLPATGAPLTAFLALDGAAILSVLDRTRRTNRSERVVGRLLRAGELKAVAGRLTPLPADPGGWLLALSPEADLTTRLLEASPGILIRAVEQMSLGATLSDRDGRIVYANRAEAEMHGYTPGELVGRSVSVLGVNEGSDAPDGTEQAEQETRDSPWVRRRANRRKDGSVFPVRLISNEIRDEEGTLLGRITISEDIAERMRLERMKEEFITVVSHELRTPLTSILASLALLRRSDPSAERARKAVDIAERNSEHLLKLVQDLLDLQTAVSGDLELAPQPVPVRALLEEAATHAATDRPSRSGVLRRRIRIDVEPDDLQVFADRSRLLQVLEHLLANALDFSPATAPVHLEAVRGPERTTLSVTDRGPGIPAELRRRLFEPFTQADASTTRPSAGPGPSLGLGLALSHALVESMGGTIDVASGPDPASPGTTVRVHLPPA